MEIRFVQIYALVDPRDGTVRYVGKTARPLSRRLKEHVQVTRANRSSWAVTVWIGELLACGLRPIITSLEKVNADDWREAERRWGAKFEALTNDAGHLGVGPDRTYIAQWTPELEARLGVESDQHIALHMGVADGAVAYRRQVLSIPANPACKGGRPRKTHCLNGHVLDASNTYVYPDGTRACSVCRRGRRRNWYQRRKAAGLVN